MDLIKLSDIKFVSGKNRRFAIFLCPYCNQEVEKVKEKGLRDKSCGCNRKHNKHGFYKHPLYTTWSNMKQRCLNPKDKDYKHYGGRGIKISSLWVDDFLTFKQWADKKGYTPGLTLDRINNNGNYEPDNCQFITNVENAIKGNKKLEKSSLTLYQIYDTLRKRKHIKITFEKFTNILKDKENNV